MVKGQGPRDISASIPMVLTQKRPLWDRNVLDGLSALVQSYRYLDLTGIDAEPAARSHGMFFVGNGDDPDYRPTFSRTPT